MKTTTRPRCSILSTAALLSLALSPDQAAAFSLQPIIPSTRTPIRSTSLQLSNNNEVNSKPLLSTLAALSVLALPLSTAVSPVNAYEESDYASETVTNVVSALKSNAGDVDGTFSTLEEVAKIITEGKGVGGSLSYGEFVYFLLLTHCLIREGVAVFIMCLFAWSELRFPC
jgi:hypothetical protein